MNPIVIGGTGGSGTRLVAEILQAAGVFIGKELNYALDALPYARLDDNYLNGKVITADRVKVAEEEHGVRVCPPARWGWKHTRSLLTLPMLHGSYPSMFLVHVIRDGRDLAYAPHFGMPVLWNGYMPKFYASPEVVIMQWSTTNMQAENYGKSYLDGYFMVKYEDLVNKPLRTIEGLYGALKLSGADASSAVGLCRNPGSIGRWRGKIDQRTQEIGETALGRFNYI